MVRDAFPYERLFIFCCFGVTWIWISFTFPFLKPGKNIIFWGLRWVSKLISSAVEKLNKSLIQHTWWDLDSDSSLVTIEEAWKIKINAENISTFEYLSKHVWAAYVAKYHFKRKTTLTRYKKYNISGSFIWWWLVLHFFWPV